MGVQGLLPMLKSVMDHVNVAKYRGKTVGIDAAGWLYKGCYSCAADVVQGNDTEGYLNFCLQQIKLLQEHEIRPLFVFDGAPLPAKAELNASRYRMRQTWRQRAQRASVEGGDTVSAYNKAISVSNAMIMKFIAILRRMNVEFLVAPYEADAQLAYLSKIKIVDVVISEDSDCIPYGCRTVLFKWNADGWASELKRRSLGANEDLSFVGWTEEMFVQLCVLCGCDYCPSVPGVGIVTAYKIVNTHKTPTEVLTALKGQKTNSISADYEEKFCIAVLTFRHHLVFDPRDEKLKMLNPLSVSADLLQRVDQSLNFLGNLELKDSLAASIAHGSIHPVTHESYAWKETAELQAPTLPGEETPKSMTSSETSSVAGTYVGQMELGCSNRSAVPVTYEDEGDRGTQARGNQGLGSSKPPLTSWRHLDGVLGTSTHILNFRSPKVSENFRSLVSTDTRIPPLCADTSAEQLKAFEDIPCRQTLKPVRNPRNRKRKHQKSGFEGEVTCRVDMSDPVSQRLSQRCRLSSERIDAPSTMINRAPFNLSGPAIQQDAVAEPPVSTRPFFASNRQFHSSTPSIVQKDHSRDASISCSGDESEDVLSLGIAGPEAGTAFNAVSARRAMSAEEKWDRILEPEIAGSDNDEFGKN